MTKQTFFYTDPVAVLWMCKSYRMRLFAGMFCLRPESVDAFFELFARGDRPERFVVAAESVPLLDPKQGDVVEETTNVKITIKRLAAKDFPLAGSGYTILHRGGRPFFAPDKAGE